MEQFKVGDRVQFHGDAPIPPDHPFGKGKVSIKDRKKGTIEKIENKHLYSEGGKDERDAWVRIDRDGVAWIPCNQLEKLDDNPSER